ncbi:unnamed protein product [Arctogadus glacialis]
MFLDVLFLEVLFLEVLFLEVLFLEVLFLEVPADVPGGSVPGGSWRFLLMFQKVTGGVASVISTHNDIVCITPRSVQREGNQAGWSRLGSAGVCWGPVLVRSGPPLDPLVLVLMSSPPGPPSPLPGHAP